MNESLNLTNLKKNELGSVYEIANGCMAKKRLYELGLHKGVEFRVVKNDIGPIILRISGNKLALGRGLAGKVLVKKCS